MVKAWYIDDVATDPTAENHLNPPVFIDLNKLFGVSGVEYFKIENITPPENDVFLQKLRKERSYTYEDEIKCSAQCISQEKLKSFYEEHLHTDEEIRLVLEGSGYFDIRDKNDKWIRIQVVPKDLIVIPSGIYHRFTLDEKNYIRVKRLFIGEPVWTAHNRPSDNMDCRKDYINKLNQGFKIPIK